MDLPLSLFSRQRPRSLVRQGLYTSLEEGMLATAFISLTQGVFLTNFVLFLGQGNPRLYSYVSIVSAIPSLVLFSYFISPILTSKLRSRRRVSMITSVIGRGFWLFIAAIPFLPLSSDGKILCLFAGLAMSSSLEVIGANAWLAWMADLVPRNVRGAFYGWRNLFSGLVAGVTVWVGAGWMKHSKDNGHEAAGYAVTFSVAVLFAVAAALVLRRQHEPVDLPRQRMDWVEMLRVPWGRPGFRRLLVFFAMWNFSLGVAGSFFTVYQKEYFGWSYDMMGYFQITVAACSLASVWFWGRRVDKVGPQRVLAHCGLLVCTLPFTWIFTTPEITWPAWMNAVLSGVLWSGFNIAAFNVAQAAAPAEGRQYYLGLLNAANGIGMLVGVIVGGQIAQWLPPNLAQWGSWTFASFFVLFAVSGIGRLVSLQVLFWGRWSEVIGKPLRGDAGQSAASAPPS